LFNTTFSHGTIRNTVVAFGALFNGLKVRRFNSNGTTQAEIDVPLAYSAREKWVSALTGNPDLLKSTSITLPRMAFEIVGYRYDATRKLNSTNKISTPVTATNTRAMAYAPVPYNLDFALYVASKTIEDGLQMLEQILPYFAPHYNMTVNTMPSLNLVEDIPVVLHQADNEDNYMAEWINERLIVYTLKFTAKVNLYGSVTNVGVIKKMDIKLHTNLQGAVVSTGENYHAQVNPLTANKGDVHTIDELWSSI
jgi:hypothetical protein